MDSLCINSRSLQLLNRYVSRPTHGLLLSGPTGVGTLTIARTLATMLRARPDDIHLVQPDEKGTISIESVRPLYQLTRAVYDSPRVIIVDDADAMGPAAQNALLKLLEEPTAQTFFILTSHQPQLLLTTITSRTQRISLQPVSDDQCREIMAREKVSVPDMAKFLFIAPGLPAELIRMARDSTYYQSQSALVTQARTLLQAAPYDRLVAIKDIKSRLQASELTLMIGRLLEFTILRNKRTDLAASLDLVEEVLARLYANGNTKIQLTYLLTKLP